MPPQHGPRPDRLAVAEHGAQFGDLGRIDHRIDEADRGLRIARLGSGIVGVIDVALRRAVTTSGKSGGKGGRRPPGGSATPPAEGPPGGSPPPLSSASLASFAIR